MWKRSRMASLSLSQVYVWTSIIFNFSSNKHKQIHVFLVTWGHQRLRLKSTFSYFQIRSFLPLQYTSKIYENDKVYTKNIKTI